MLKRFVCFVSVTVLLFTLLVSVSGADDGKLTQVYIDGDRIELDVPPQDTGYDYMMVPIRAVAEYLGAEVLWNEDKQGITLVTQKGTVTLIVGNNRLIRNEEVIQMWAPVIVTDGRSLIHYRCLEDCFDVHANWDKANDRVVITTDNSLYDVMQKGEMVIGIDGEFPPMGFMDENGKFAGFDVELAQEAAKRLGVDLTVKPIDWAYNLEELNSNHVDMIWNGMTVTEKRKEQMLFSDPYMEEGYVVVAKKDSQIVTREQLEEAQIGYLYSLRSFGFLDYDMGIDEEIRANLKEFDNEQELLRALDSGEIDAFFARKIDVQYNLMRNSDAYKPLGFLFNKENWAVAFRKNDIYLRNAVQKAIDEMKKDGTYHKILSKWFGEDRVNYISYDENHNLLYNGIAYRRCKDPNWRANEVGERLGAVSQWGDDLKFVHLSMEFEAGVFEVKDSGGAALHIYPPNSEFDALYLRSDIEVPELSLDNIDRIELTNDYMGYDHVVCDKGTTDKTVIHEFMSLLLFSENASVDTPYSSSKTVLLYSNAMPGCIYPILLYEKDGVSFVKFDGRLIILPEELLSRLGSVH